MLEEAAQRGFYSPLFYRDLIGDPTGLSLPMFMEELFWGCAGIGLAIVMPALALSAIGQAASPEQMLQWAPECFGTPGDLKLAALAISEPEGGSDMRNLRTRARRDGSGNGDWIINGPGHRIPAGGLGNSDRRCPPADLACLLDGRQRGPIRARRGLHVEARRQRGCRQGHRARDPDDGRLGLHHRSPSREVVSRCQAVHHL